MTKRIVEVKEMTQANGWYAIFYDKETDKDPLIAAVALWLFGVTEDGGTSFKGIASIGSTSVLQDCEEMPNFRGFFPRDNMRRAMLHITGHPTHYAITDDDYERRYVR